MTLLHDLDSQLCDQLRLSSYPLAVKLLGSETDVPAGCVRPSRDLGYRLSTCQAFAMSRRRGLAIAQLLDDMWCPEPVIGYGLAEPPRTFLAGHNRYPRDVASLSAGARWAQGEFPRLQTGRYVGIASAPLGEAQFEPDVIIVYCNPAQLTLLLLGVAYEEGRDVKSTLGGHAACVYAVVPPHENDDFWVATPCMGDRRHAMADDCEMIFSLPIGRARSLLEGLRHIQTTDRSVPFGRDMAVEYELMGAYADIAGELGIGGPQAPCSSKDTT